MLTHFDTPIRQILMGNISLIICCGFYLAWWIVAFHPAHAVKGIKSGWLLLPAAVFGIAAIIQIVRGCLDAQTENVLIPGSLILVAGIVIYIVLLAATSLILKRQVTTELLLIVGWTVLMFSEWNILFGTGTCSGQAAAVFLTATTAAAVISLICYLLYYNLNGRKGYIDGMIPLLLIAVIMTVTTVRIVR